MDQRHEFARTAATRIVAGAGVEQRVPELLRELDPDGVVVVYDPAVAPIAERLGRGPATRALLPVDLEPPVKSLAALGALATGLHAAGATRATALIVVGGGTATDLGGFLASVYLRGMPCVLCPTTTLAMCDAAIGGKNGVDHDGLKNRLGTIRQPDLIVADTDWLAGLPDASFRDGLVEAVKKAAVLDAARFAALERLAPALVGRDRDATLAAVTMAIEMKMSVVLADEREADRRRALNFGHTIGHAIESLAAGRLLHGAAVAMGMIAECRAAGVDAAVIDRIGALLRAIGAPTTVPTALADRSRLWALAQHDKKAQRGRVPIHVPVAVGVGRTTDLTENDLRRALA